MEEDFRDYVLDQLSGLDDISFRRMFGSYGLYYGVRFFGIVHESVVYFKTNEKSKKEYIAFGMKPFQPSKKQILKNYYEVPIEILEDKDKFAKWARCAAKLSSIKI